MRVGGIIVRPPPTTRTRIDEWLSRSPTPSPSSHHTTTHARPPPQPQQVPVLPRPKGLLPPRNPPGGAPPRRHPGVAGGGHCHRPCASLCVGWARATGRAGPRKRVVVVVLVLVFVWGVSKGGRRPGGGPPTEKAGSSLSSLSHTHTRMERSCSPWPTTSSSSSSRPSNGSSPSGACVHRVGSLLPAIINFSEK